jgi:hypothetical protein
VIQRGVRDDLVACASRTTGSHPRAAVDPEHLAGDPGRIG